MTAQARITSLAPAVRSKSAKETEIEEFAKFLASRKPVRGYGKVKRARDFEKWKKWKYGTKNVRGAKPEELKALGRAITDLRKKQGLGREKFASLIGLSYSNTANIETGQNWPSMPVYIKICSVLGIGVPPLVG